ncbi:MAG: hypothetical protein R2817_01605 [Flavobacteriales bacterium]
MNRRSTVLLITLLAVFSAQAQWTPLPPDALPDSARHLLRVEGALLYNSNAIFNELPGHLLRGEDLERELRQRSSDALAGRERAVFGYGYHGRLTWTGARLQDGRSRWRPTASFALQEYAGARITPDLYDLVFFGNARFEGRTAALAPAAYEQVRYSALGIGVVDQHTRSFVRLALVQGSSLTAVDVNWADLYTGVDGRVLRSAVLASYLNSDTAGNDWARNNGLGAAVSGQWETRIRSAARPTYLSVGVEDLGVVRWNANSVRLDKDTVIRYEGLAVDNVLDLDAILIGEYQLLDTFGLRYRTGARTRLLPFRAHLAYRVEGRSGWHFALVAQYQHLPSYLPQLTAGLARRMSERGAWGASVSYGGYGGLLVGAGGRYRVGRRITVEASVPQLIGFAGGRTRGLGALLAVQVAL